MGDDETVPDAPEIPLEEQGDVRERWRAMLDASVATRSLEDGHELRLPPGPEWLRRAADLLSDERECSPFLRLELISEASSGDVIVRIREDRSVPAGTGTDVEELVG